MSTLTHEDALRQLLRVCVSMDAEDQDLRCTEEEYQEALDAAAAALGEPRPEPPTAVAAPVTAVDRPLVLVACCGAKLKKKAKAKDMYTSQLFTKSRAWAEAQGGDWRILSAQHHVLDPEEVIKPYDTTMPKTHRGRMAWTMTVVAQLQQYRGRRIIVLAGNDYCGWIGVDPQLRVERPMQGLGIGQQYHFLGRSNDATHHDLVQGDRQAPQHAQGVGRSCEGDDLAPGSVRGLDGRDEGGSGAAPAPGEGHGADDRDAGGTGHQLAGVKLLLQRLPGRPSADGWSWLAYGPKTPRMEVRARTRTEAAEKIVAAHPTATFAKRPSGAHNLER